MLLDQQDLLATNSVTWSTGRFVQVSGAAVALGVIHIVGPEAAFIFNACSFLVVATLLLLLSVPPPRVSITEYRINGSAARSVGIVPLAAITWPV